MSSVPAIRVRELVKQYGDRRALDGVSLEVRAGTVFGLLGANGSGKTTLLKVLATLLVPASGEVEVAGARLPRDGHRVRQRTALLLDAPLFPRDFTLAEGLRYHADLYGITDVEARVDAVAERVGLGWRVRDPLRTFSRGMAQRASLACALLVDPEVLLLDEPFTALDPGGCQLVEEVVDETRRRGRTVVLVTHDLERARRLCDEVAILHRGRVRSRGRKGEWSVADVTGDR